MSDRQRRRAKRLAQRRPGSPAHLRSLLDHRILAQDARSALRTGEVTPRLKQHILRATERELARLTKRSRRTDTGAELVQRMTHERT